MSEAARDFDLLACVACGLCLEHCPTYDLRRDEASGPRGRIRLLDQLLEGREVPPPRRSHQEAWTRYIDECLGCLACEANCPAGVPFRQLLDRGRGRLAGRPGRLSLSERAGRWALDNLLPRPDRIRRLVALLRAIERLGLLRLLTRLRVWRLPGLSSLEALRWLPPSSQAGPSPPKARPGAPFLFFPGCISGPLFPREERATLRLLDAAGGYDRIEGATCCGAAHRHRGDLAGAAALARRNILAFENLEGNIVTQSAGCGAALREYGDWLADDPEWAGRARGFSSRIRSLDEVVDPAMLGNPVAPEREPLRLAYDDPCHAVHAQGIAEKPRQLLDAVPGIRRVEMPHADRCCGAGGTWFLAHRELSEEILADKMREIRDSGADILATANPGCRIQWEAALGESGLDVRVMHVAEIWAESLKPPRG